MSVFLLLLMLCISGIAQGCDYNEPCQTCVGKCYFVTFSSNNHVCLDNVQALEGIATFLAPGTNPAWCPSISLPFFTPSKSPSPPPLSSTERSAETEILNPNVPEFVPKTTKQQDDEKEEEELSSSLFIVVVVVVVIIIIIIAAATSRIIYHYYFKKDVASEPGVDIDAENAVNEINAVCAANQS